MQPKILEKFREVGILGINKRNADYLLPYNQRRLYPLVDDKLRTKQLAQQAGIAVPQLYYTVEVQRQIRDLPEALSQFKDFVVKPAHGTGGEGILVVTSHTKQKYRLINGIIMDQEEINFHISSTLSGIYSLGGQSDKVIIEYRVKSDPIFDKVTYQGVPDIRVILFCGIPAMAMVRLPSRKSRGRANLHQGAVGAGIDLQTGLTLKAVYENTIIDEHPDTGCLIEGLVIPDWNSVLHLAAKSYNLTKLDYQGVDIVLDKDLGALVLELNARPGLSIQLANNSGLLTRLELIKQHKAGLQTVEQRVEFAQTQFVSSPQ
jgi:alpha-L-glutamate ligase-like protein